jgi:hypothetical protein
MMPIRGSEEFAERDAQISATKRYQNSNLETNVDVALHTFIIGIVIASEMPVGQSGASF